MLRRLATAALVLVAALVLAVLPWPTIVQSPKAGAADLQLKRDVQVSGDVVRIGDLVQNAGRHAETPVFRAPDLGKTGTIQTSRVLEALASHGLLQVTTTGIREVVVTRAVRTVAARDIEMALASEIGRQAGLPRDADIAIVIQGDMPILETEAGSKALPVVERALWDQRSGRFEAFVSLPPATGARAGAIRVVGTATEMVDVVVPVRAVNRGEPMRAADLVIERRPRAEAGTDAVVDLRVATTLVPRRSLRAGQPLRTADLTKPDLVARNDTVTLVYEIPGISLTVRGKALEAGAEGDTVSVVNVQSKRTVQAVVTGPGRVSVGPARVETTASAADVTGSITRR